MRGSSTNYKQKSGPCEDICCFRIHQIGHEIDYTIMMRLDIRNQGHNKMISFLGKANVNNVLSKSGIVFCK